MPEKVDNSYHNISLARQKRGRKNNISSRGYLYVDVFKKIKKINRQIICTCTFLWFVFVEREWGVFGGFFKNLVTC